jgi:hypothetical protein
MSQELGQEQLIRSYLLGELPASEQELVEERLVTDQDQGFFDAFLIIEGELFDDYVLGRISEQERAKLERGLLRSPHESRKVAFVKTLEQYIAHSKELTEAPRPSLSNSVPAIFTRLRSWLTDLVPAPALQNSNLGAAQSTPSSGEEQKDQLWEQTLNEAHANRNLILTLINDHWLGMKLLLQLKALQSATPANLASLLDRDESSVVGALNALSDSGLVRKHRRDYSCSEMGHEVLDKLHTIVSST